MATPDRTEELIRAMLERRSAEPAPPWLADRTMHAVTAARQERRGLAGRIPLPDGTPARVALAAAITLLLAALVGSALAAGGLLDDVLDPGPGLPAVVVDPGDGSPTAGSLPPDGVASPGPTEASPMTVPTPRPAPDTLAPDTLAVVTKGGTDLRVRTAPGVGSDSKKLEPLLPTGTRMFVVGGPVTADGYDWYEVQTDADEGEIDLYGWVAAADKEGRAWIKPTDPNCPDARDGLAMAEATPLDRLACFGDAQFEIVARQVFLMGDEDDSEPCPWSPGHNACSIEPSWLGVPVELFIGEFETGTGEMGGALTMSVAVPPEVLAAAPGLEDAEDVRVTLSADSPEARDCRFLDRSGDEVRPRARAILECRTRLVVRDLSWDTSRQPTGELPTDSMATVDLDAVEVWSAPEGQPGATVLYEINQGALVYVDAGPEEVDGEAWYALLPEDPGIGRYGWVRAMVDDEQILGETGIECPGPTDWAAYNELSTVRRLACTDGDPVTVNVVIDAVPEPQPTSAFACMAFPYIAGRPPCQATPEWLASPTGVDVTGPGSLSFPALDPDLMAQSELPTTPTVLRVPGRYEHPDAADCRVTNPLTGEELMARAESAIYCRARFVIEDAAPVN